MFAVPFGGPCKLAALQSQLAAAVLLPERFRAFVAPSVSGTVTTAGTLLRP